MSDTMTELLSQPELWRRAVDEAANHREALLAPGERVLVFGCGTSAFVAAAYASLRESAGLGWTDAAYASELPREHGYDRVVALTRSGTTTEVLEALERFKGTRRVVVTAVAQPVAALAEDIVLLDWADERSVVQTRFPTTLLALVRAALGEQLEAAIADAQSVLRSELPVDPARFSHFVSLGHGWTVGLAHEAALKIRESSQAWAESYPALDYRHGPIAVAGSQTLIQTFGRIPESLAGDIRAVGATLLSDPIDPLAQLVSAQRLAVTLAELRGLNPDRPRHLARSVVLDSTTV
jgi:glucosamine--fructose-6-phosphate aminotransferase (isomerizing)